MRLFEHETFVGLRDFESKAVFSDFEFRNCTFESCSLSATTRPDLRSTVRNMRMYHCSVEACFVDAAICEEVTIDGLKTTGDLLIARGTVFKHCVLRGKIGRVMIAPSIFSPDDASMCEAAFTRANSEYYKDVDWALDIRHAEFNECELRGMPARLVVRDPETQAVIRRESVLRVDWRKVEFNSPVTQVLLSYFLDHGDPDMVMVAPKRYRGFADYLKDMELLRAAGIADPD